MSKRVVVAIILTPLLMLGLYFVYGQFVAPARHYLPASNLSQEQKSRITFMAEDLDTPWSIATLSNDRIIVTERSGTIRVIGAESHQFQIADVAENGEGGLLGLAIDPGFSDNHFVYIYKTANSSNTVERYRFINNQLVDKTSILSNIPAAANHNGGAIGLGPDGKLYITTGDAQAEDLAQDRSSLAGKILRINADGSVPPDNPFGNEVWSYGHRNPQGLAWDDQGRLWSTEHGPSGSQSGNDELNLIEKGGNYGWPVIRGSQTRDGMIAPIAESGANDTWAPAGLAYVNGALYFTGLRGRTLYKANIEGQEVQISRHLIGTYGRLRAVTSYDSALLISTSNKDGRGSPQKGDDKILRVPLDLL